jgi:hypothetical protein
LGREISEVTGDGGFHLKDYICMNELQDWIKRGEGGKKEQ